MIVEINQILPKEEFESGKAFIQNCLTTKVPDLYYNILYILS